MHVCACVHDNSSTSVPKCNKIKYDLDGGGGTVERILMQLETLYSMCTTVALRHEQRGGRDVPQRMLPTSA